MRSLASLLEDAARQSAFEVILESGRPVVYTTARGSEAESATLPRTELFDMIVAAVDEEQQVELAVGNAVEFELDAEGSWSIHAEPGAEGIVVHARREGGPAAGLEIDLDYAGGSRGGGPVGFELEEPEFDVGLESASERSAPRTPGSGPPSQLYVEALDVPSLEEALAPEFEAGAPDPAAPFESGTWALADDDDFEVGLDDEEFPDEDSLPTGFSDSASAFASEASSDGHIGVPDDDDESEFDGFSEPGPPPPSASERRRTLSPTVRAMDATPTPPAAGPTVPPPPGTDASQTRRDVGVQRSPDADTERDMPSFGHGEPELNELTADIAEGTLVYVREIGLADTLAQSLQAPSIVIEDRQDPVEVWANVRTLPAGALVIVRCEDPSVWLPGILRRLEEGYRVFVETRARTAEGARRVLLGVDASQRAEQWLDAQVSLTLEPGEGGPHLVPI
jgi:hypothetical protein